MRRALSWVCQSVPRPPPRTPPPPGTQYAVQSDALGVWIAQRLDGDAEPTGEYNGPRLPGESLTQDECFPILLGACSVL